MKNLLLDSTEIIVPQMGKEEMIAVDELINIREFDREINPTPNFWGLGVRLSLDELTENIRTHGIRKPLIILIFEGKKMIVDGNNRLAAAIRLGLHQLPGIVRKPIDDDEIKYCMERMRVVLKECK
jgi:hypothetical protein